MTAPTATPAVIELRADAHRTRVRLEDDPDPFATLSVEARVRLLVRVLCELVAYDARPAGAERRG